MKTVRDIMTTSTLSVTPDTKVTDAANVMLEHHFNGLPVVNAEGTLEGVVTQSDLVRQHKKLRLPSFFVLWDAFIPLSSPKKFEEEIRRMTGTLVSDVMSTPARVVAPEDSVETVATLMLDGKLYTVPVVENGKLVGVVGKEDLLRALIPS